VIVEPPKKIGEMTDVERSAFADLLFEAVAKAAHRPSQS
jgi:hypothetical protein